MKFKWQWFVGGRVMFWITIIIFVVLAIGFTITYILDPITHNQMEVQKIDPSSIKTIAKSYLDSLRSKNRETC